MRNLPSYFRLDAWVAKTFLYRDHTFEVSFDMMNVTFSNEVLFYNYGYQTVNGQKVLLFQAEGIRLVLPILGFKGTY